MEVEIITAEEKVYSAKAIQIKLLGINGSFGILKNHAPIISKLKDGTVKIITEDKKEKYFYAENGIIEFYENKAVILADKVELADTKN